MKMFISKLRGVGTRQTGWIWAIVITASFMLAVTDGALARGAGANCRASVDAKLTELGISPDDVESRELVADTSGGEARQLMGYSSWVRLKSCKGYVVIGLSTDCKFEQAYTKGECKIIGLKSY